MQLKNTTINGIAALAPMAGVADRAFRELCVSFGASYCVGEMASAKGLCMCDRESSSLLEISESERPMSVQLFGDNPEYIAKAMKKALAFSPVAVDINMGCPTPKITSNGCGSALMKNPSLCAEIVSAAVAAAQGVPVSVKIRKGWDDEHINAVQIAQLCEKSGASLVTVHARTRAQMYAPPADWSVIKAVKEAVSVPVIGNGDIFSAQDAMKMLEETNCDMVMVGRAALGNPFIFRDINALYNHNRPLPDPGLFERMRVMRGHIEKLVEYKGEYIGMREARKHCAWYIKGIRGAARLRVRCAGLTRLEDIDSLIAEIVDTNKL